MARRFFGRAGIRKVDMPNINGLTRNQAKSALESVGLSWEEVAEDTSNINLDLSIKNQPIAQGTTLRIGEKITFTYYNYVAPPNFNPGFNPGFQPINPGFPPQSDCIDDDAGFCNGGIWFQYQYSPSGQFSCAARNTGSPCINPPNPGFNPGFNEPAFNEPAFNEPNFANPGFADPGFDITLASLDLSALFSFGGKSVGITTLVRTTDGLVKAGDLRVGDTLLSANIEGFPYEGDEGITAQAIAWSDSNPNIIPEITTIANIYKTQSAYAVVINEDIFSQYHYILIKRDGVSKFETSVNIIKETDLVYSYDTSSWEPIYLYEIIQAPHDIISINCEPYDMFFTERMLTHDSSAI